MAEKRTYNAKMNAKGLEKSVSEDQARHMAGHQGNTYTFIVQAHAGPKTVNEDGSEVVSLIPDLVELVPEQHAERVHQFQRALYLARPEQFGQAAFESAGADEPKPEEAAEALSAVVETDASGQPTGVWDGSTDGPLDGPLPDAPEGAYPADSVAIPPAEPSENACGFPGCILPDEHDGDHEPGVSVPADADGNGQVVEFSSGKSTKAKAKRS